MARATYKTFLRTKGRTTPPPSIRLRSSDLAQPGHVQMPIRKYWWRDPKEVE
jgi:hypothetical protein